MTEPIPRRILELRKECCGNGCRNCPYLPKHLKGSKKIGQEINSCPISNEKSKAN